MEFIHFTSSYLRKRNYGWAGVVRYKDDAGAWRSKQKAFPDHSKREARAALDAWRIELEETWGRDQGFDVSTSQPVEVYVRTYLDNLQKTGARARSTMATYRHMLKHLERNPIGKIPFRDLEPKQVEEWMISLREAGKSAATIQKAYNVLHGAYAQAVERGQLPYDPIASVSRPKVPATKRNAVKKSDCSKLTSYLDLVDESPVNMSIILALYTGMREGEICALRWSDIDFDDNTITVMRSVARDDGVTYIKEPKGKKPLRTIPIPTVLRKHLLSRREIMRDECETMIVPFKESMYVTGKPSLSPKAYEDPHQVWHGWKTVASSLGLRGTMGKTPTFHDLRHTYATMAIAEGADIKSVQTILGHAKAQTTLDIYADTTSEAMRKTADLTAGALRAPSVSSFTTRRESPSQEARPLGKHFAA
jgi:integrase